MIKFDSDWKQSESNKKEGAINEKVNNYYNGRGNDLYDRLSKDTG